MLTLPEPGDKSMHLQPILIIGLVLAALLYASAAVIYRRKGLRTKSWYALLGACSAALLGFALLGLLGFFSQATAATVATMVAAFAIVFALQWRPPTDQRSQ